MCMQAYRPESAMVRHDCITVAANAHSVTGEETRWCVEGG